MQDEEKVRVHTQVSNVLLTIEQLSGSPQEQQCPFIRRRLRSELEGLIISGSSIGDQNWEYKLDLYDLAVDALCTLPTDLERPISDIILQQMHVDFQLAAVMAPETVMAHVGGKSIGGNRISRYMEDT